APIRVDREPEGHARALRHRVDGRARVDLVEADVERFRGIEGAHHRRIAESRKRRPLLVFDGQVLPAHEHMFADPADGTRAIAAGTAPLCLTGALGRRDPPRRPRSRSPPTPHSPGAPTLSGEPRQHYGLTFAVLLTASLAFALQQTMVAPA